MQRPCQRSSLLLPIVTVCLNHRDTHALPLFLSTASFRAYDILTFGKVLADKHLRENMKTAFLLTFPCCVFLFGFL